MIGIFQKQQKPFSYFMRAISFEERSEHDEKTSDSHSGMGEL